jgi:DNA-binding transcriptional ArsR family regulator
MTLPKATTKPERERSIEEAVSYAVAHRVRIEALCVLNERTYSAQELARVIQQPLSTVTHHVEELLKSGSIEVAETKQIRNISQNFYRAVEIPFLSDKQMEALPRDARQEIYGLILQASISEVLASFSAGKLSSDPRVVLAWRWFNVDAQGRKDIADEQARSWERVTEIEAESAARRADSGEEATSVIVTSFGYERSRTSPSPPAHVRGKLSVRETSF